MKYIQGQNRTQTSLFPVSLEETIAQENEVRLIDLFVSSLKLSAYGFKVDFGENGRPAYHPADLLKLYIYGYMNKVRSSRDLEKECNRNIEVFWLLNNLKPDHNTISNFRRDNSKAIKKVFRETVRLAKHFNLIGGRLIAGDSTKFRAQNSKKNNYNQKKIDRHLEYIENKLEEYNSALALSDGDTAKAIKEEIKKHEKRKENYKDIERQLQESGEPQVSTSDPQSRQLLIRNNITEVAYNSQVTTDAKYNLPIDYKATNTNDSKAMGNMLQRAKSILHTNEFTALFDKGYHTGSELHIADRLGVSVLVAIPGIPRSSEAPDPQYNVEHFIYNNKEDSYTCPEGQKLTTNGTWYKNDRGNTFQQYKTRECKQCPVRMQCTRSEQNGKVVRRGQYAANIEANQVRVERNKELYRKRQAIVEHPFGTLKRQWGFSYILTKQGIDRASSDVGLMLTAYNLRRIINIIGYNQLEKYLKGALNLILFILSKIGQKLACLTDMKFWKIKLSSIIIEALKRLFLTQKLVFNGGF